MAIFVSASSSQRSIILAGILVIVVCHNFFTAAAWTTTTTPMFIQRPHHRYLPSSRSTGWSATQLSYRDDEHDSADSKKTKSPFPANDFQSRMKRAALQRVTSSKRRTSWRPPNVKTAVSLEEFASVIQEGRTNNQLVVVRFYATWCKKCHAIRPSFDKVASSKPEVIFVDVPVTNTNVELHQGLKVTSVPFAHIYCPDKGLVVEEKISRSRFSEFEDLVEKHSSII
mmetsp:Transcript_2047/g.3367  ORF Transcript_2047/g.3367 Transcript_2047/m.3367 type:complete len:227 (-) Transcript_2047:112-792(-)|eukprot:scaffold307_cov146-Skeletonema_menzelii.AAC.14